MPTVKRAATPSSFRRSLFVIPASLLVIPAQAGASADGTSIQRGGAKAVNAEFHAIIIAP